MNPIYIFHLPNEKKKLYDRLALFMFLLSAAVLLIRFFFFRDRIHTSAGRLFLYLTAAFWLVLQIIVVARNKVRTYVKVFSLAAFYLSLFWFLTAPWWAGILNLLLILGYLAAQRELLIRVSNEAIIYPSFPSEKIEWEALSNLVLKEGLLTLDFKNDRLIQHYPDSKMNLPDEKEFNEFCRARVGGR